MATINVTPLLDELGGTTAALTGGISATVMRALKPAIRVSGSAVTFPEPVSSQIINGVVTPPFALTSLPSDCYWSIRVTISGGQTYTTSAILPGGADSYDIGALTPVDPTSGVVSQGIVPLADAFVAGLMGDPDSLTGEYLTNTFGSAAVAAWLSDPSNPLTIAITILIQSGLSTVLGTQYIASDMTVPRAAGHTGPLIWGITAAGGTPEFSTTGDLIANVTPTPLPPVTIWSDNASVDGALGTTEVGGKNWVVFSSGTAYTAAKVGGVVKITTAGTGTCAIGVDSGNPNRIGNVTGPAVGTQFVGTHYPRYLNTGNYISLERTSSTDGTYRLRKRVANTVSEITTLTGFVKANGDVVSWTTKDDGTLIIRINGTQAYSGNVPDFATTGTFDCVGVTSPSSATTPTWDAFNVTTLGG